MAELQKQAKRMLRTPEGRLALKQALLGTDEGRDTLSQIIGKRIETASTTTKPIVAVCIPSHDMPKPETQQAFQAMEAFSREHCHIIVRPSIHSSIVSWVRNHLLFSLYADKVPFTHVLFMDDDIVPAEDVLLKMLSRNADIVGAVCTVRQDPPMPNVRLMDEEGHHHTADIPRAGVYKVAGIGTGLMLISRKALDAVGEYYLNCEYERKYWKVPESKLAEVSAARRKDAALTHNRWWFELLKQPDGSGEFGEDISFCFKARECGFDIYADATTKTGHIGRYAFSIEDYWYYRPSAIASGLVKPFGKKEPAEEMSVSLLVPTRGRPDNVERFLASVFSTAETIPEVVFYVDDDDPKREEILAILNREHAGQHIKKVTGPRICLSECWNEAYRVATGDILMHAGDDIVFKTKGWDRMVVDAFQSVPDRILFAHGDDLSRTGKDFGTHGFIHRKWVDAVGYFVPPYFSSDYNDTWLNDIANTLGRRVFLPFVTEHMHPLFGKGEWDQTHKERLVRHKADGVDEKYKALAPQRQADAEKLAAVMATKHEAVTA